MINEKEKNTHVDTSVLDNYAWAENSNYGSYQQMLSNPSWYSAGEYKAALAFNEGLIKEKRNVSTTTRSN